MASVRFELDADDTLTALASELADFIPKRLPRLIARDVLPPLQRQLDRLVDDNLVKRVPPPRVVSERLRGSTQGPNTRAFRWSWDEERNNNARRWFFRNYPNGYKRTGALPRAWRGDIVYEASSSVITTTIENPADAASYVFGAEEHGFQQVPGHQQTGWLNSGQVVPDLLLDISTQLDDRLSDAIDTEIAKL